MMLKKRLKGAGGGSDGPSYKDDNLFSKDRAELLIGISEGPIKGVKDGSLKNVFIGETPVKSPAGNINFEVDDICLLMCEGSANQSAWAPVLGGTGQFHGVNVSMSSEGLEVVRTVPTSLAGLYDRVDINLSIDRLVYSSEKGTDYATLDMKVEWRVAGKTGWHTVWGSSWKGKTTSGFKTQLSIYGLRNQVKEGDHLELKVTRLSKDSTDEYLAEVTWLGFDTIDTGKQKPHKDLAQMHFYANSNEQLSGVPNISAIWDGLMVPVPTNYDPVRRTYDESSPWDGSFTVAKFWTDNPIWLTRELVKNTRFGLAAYNKFIRINEYSWYEHAKHCDEKVDDGRGGKQPRYTFNGVISEIRDGTDMLNYILSSCNALVKDDNNGLLKLYADRPNSASVLITPEMVQEDPSGVKLSYSYTDVFSRANEIRASFINPDRNWEQDFISVRHQEAIDRFGLVLEEFDATGCTDSHEATRKAMMRLLSAQTETTTVGFTLNRMGLTLEPFQIFLLADPSRHWAESRRADTLGGTALTFKRPIYFEAPGTYTVRIASTAGLIERTAKVTSKGNTTSLKLNKAVDVELAEHFAFSVEGNNEVGMAKPFRVLRCDPADSFGMAWSVTAVEVNRNKYTGADTAKFIDIDLYGNKKPENAPTVVNFVAKVEREQVDGEYQQVLKMSWDNPTGHSGLLHKVYANINGSGLSERGQTRGNSFEIRDLSYGTYQVQIYTQSMYGVGESEIRTVQALGSNSEDWLQDPQNLTITADPAFVGADLLVDCGATFIRDGFPVDLVVDGRIGAFVFEIQTPKGLKTRRSPSKQWLYRHAEMVQDFEGVPPATINISIKIADHYGGMAGNQPLIITTEGNPRITAFKMNVRDTHVSAVPLWDQPAITEEVSWYLAESNSFGAAEFIGKSAVLDYSNLRPSTKYYLWAEMKPEFGQIQLFPSKTTGNAFTTMALAEVVLPELEGSVGLDILDKNLQDSIGKIDPLDDRLTAGLEDLENTKDVLDTVKTQGEATHIQMTEVQGAVRETLDRLDTLSESTTQAIVDVDNTVREVAAVKDTVDNVENHLGQIEADVEQAQKDFDQAIGEANDKINQAQGDIDAAKGELDDLSGRVDKTEISMGDLGTSVDEKLASTDEKLSAVDAELDAKAKELQDLIDQNYDEYIEFREAIITIDPDTGDITLEALAILQEEMRADFLKVNMRIDAVEGIVEQKAEKTTVTEQGTQLTEVESRLSAAEGLLSQKASIKDVEGNTTKISEVGQELDAVKGELSQKAEAGEVDEQGKRLAVAEETLKATTSDVESLAQQTGNLTAALEGTDQRLTASIEDLSKVVVNEKESTAQRFSELTTEVGDTKTSIAELAETVNTGDTATNKRIDTMEATVGENTAGIKSLEKTVVDLDSALSSRLDTMTSEVGDNKASIDGLTETVATNEQATAQKFTELESEVDGNKAGISSLSKTVADLDSAMSQQLDSLESSVGDNAAEISNLRKTNADEHGAMAQQISELDAKTETSNANITALAKVVADGDQALAEQITQMGTHFEGELSKTDAKFTESVKTLTEADRALAQQVSQLGADLETEAGKLSASINELADVVAKEDEALARQLNELAAEVGQNEAAITELRQVVVGSDSSLAEIFQELNASLDWVADTTAGNAAGLDEEVQNRVRGEAEIKKAQKVLVDTDQALAQLIENLRAEFETNNSLTEASIKELKTAIADQDKALAQVKQELVTQMEAGDLKLDGKINTVIESVTSLEETLQTVKTELEGSISDGDTALDGKISQVTQNLVDLEKSLQTIKQELEASIESGDTELEGSISTVAQNLVTLEESVQTLRTELESSISEGDKALDGKITTVTQNLTTLEQSVQTMRTELEASITAGDKALDGKITTVTENLVELEKSLQSVKTELEGSIEAGDTALDGRLTQVSQNLVTLEQSVQTIKAELEASISDGDTTLDGKISTLTQNLVDLERSLQTIKQELEGAISDGDTALDGKITTLTQNLVTLEQSMQTLKTTLEGAIEAGDKALEGQISTVSQNLVELDKTVQTMETNLSGQITDGDKALQGQVNTVKQNVVDLDKTVQSLETNLSGQITEGDKALQGKIDTVTQNVVELDESIQTMESTLSGKITEGDNALSGQISTVSQNLVNLEKSLQAVKTELEGEIESGDTELAGSVSEVMENLVTLEKSVQTLRTDLEGQITDGDTALAGSISEISQVVTDVEQTVAQVFRDLSAHFETVADAQADAALATDDEVKQRMTADAKLSKKQTVLANEQEAMAQQLLEMTADYKKGDAELSAGLTQLEKVQADDQQALATAKRELTTSIEAGDKKLDGKILEVSESVTSLEETLQTVKTELEGSISAGDTELDGKISQVLQNVVDLEKSLQTIKQELEASIESGDTELDGKISTVTQNLVDLEQSLQTIKQELEGSITEGDKALDGKIATVTQNLVTLEQSVQTMRTELESSITDGDKELDGKISTVTQNLTDLEKSVQSMRTELEGSITAGDKALEGSIATVAENLVTLERSLQTIKQELEGSISEGDTALDGKITQVSQNLVTLEQSVQTIKQELEGAITEGDKALEGQVRTVAQNVVTLEGSVQTMGTELTGKIETGDKALEGQIQTVAQNLVDLDGVVQEMETTLTGKIEDQGEILEGAIQENMELVLQGGETFAEFEDFTLAGTATKNTPVKLPEEYPNGSAGFIKGVIANLPEGKELRVTYGGTQHKVTTNGPFSLPVALLTGTHNLSLANNTGAVLTITALRMLSQESKAHYAQWSVKSEVNGLKGGVGFVNDGTKVVFALDVDTLVMYDRETGELTSSPFYVQDGVVFIKEASIADAVVANKLKVGAKLYAPYIANREGSNPEFELDGKTGRLKGAIVEANSGKLRDRLTIGNGYIDGRTNQLFIRSYGGRTTISHSGYLYCVSGRFQGDITGSNGKFSGTVSASQVTGAKVQRASGSFLVGSHVGNRADDELKVHKTWEAIDTGYAGSSWGDGKRTFIVECSIGGGVYAYNSQSNWTHVQWGARAKRVYNTTRWSGGARIMCDIEWFTRLCMSRSDTRIYWKLWELL